MARSGFKTRRYKNLETSEEVSTRNRCQKNPFMGFQFILAASFELVA
jgi:hypothetical protein